MRSVTVFCGSNPGNDARYAESAEHLGQLLADRNIRIVFGGASVGIMGRIADAALAHGGEVIGVLPRSLRQREIGHRSLTELHITETMHERKALMAELGDAFIALPGGFGTLDEVLEMLTWTQLGLHHKPVGFLNTLGFWDGLQTFLEHAANAHFVRVEHLGAAFFTDDAESLLDQLDAWKPIDAPKWVDADGNPLTFGATS